MKITTKVLGILAIVILSMTLLSFALSFAYGEYQSSNACAEKFKQPLEETEKFFSIKNVEKHLYDFLINFGGDSSKRDITKVKKSAFKEATETIECSKNPLAWVITYFKN